MKLISLNIWGGHEFEALIYFVKEQSKDTDIFCFQEIFDTPTERKIVEKEYRANILSELKNALPEHVCYFSSFQEGHGIAEPVDFEIYFGEAMFIRKSIDVKDTGEIFIFGNRNSKDAAHFCPRTLQYAKINEAGEVYTIAHFHGLWMRGTAKKDNEFRIIQSTKVKEIMDKIKGKKILCGDFNLAPDTKSIAILEENMINLIKEKNIDSTRSRFYEKPNKYADYMIVSPEVNVESFEVPQMDISDHLPMILKFS